MTISSNTTQGAGTFSGVSAHFAMNYWVLLFCESPFQRHWSRRRSCMWGCSFSAVHRVLQRAVKAENSNKNGVLQLSRGHSAGKWQELHPSPETELFANSTVPSQGNYNSLIVPFSNRSIICPSCFLLLSSLPSPRISNHSQFCTSFWGREKCSERLTALNVMETFANEWALVMRVTRKHLIDSGHQITGFN